MLKNLLQFFWQEFFFQKRNDNVMTAHTKYSSDWYAVIKKSLVVVIRKKLYVLSHWKTLVNKKSIIQMHRKFVCFLFCFFAYCICVNMNNTFLLYNCFTKWPGIDCDELKHKKENVCINLQLSAAETTECCWKSYWKMIWNSMSIFWNGTRS